ncbi:hypothetical protein K4F52_010365 [Lecanicillium sp. MT-2017a]|nr:hypothetical protein K4F52_010365 [Lecanicillium sp. MT-2017a]
MEVDRLINSMFEKKQLEWLEKMLARQKRIQIGDFMSTVWGGVATRMRDAQAGSYNLVHVMEFDNGYHAVFRHPNKGSSMFPNEKTRNEVNVMRLVADRTTIPVACVKCAKLRGDPKEKGTETLDTDDLRPFILMDHLRSDGDMGQALNTPGFNIEDRQVLDPEIEIDKLAKQYGLAAKCLLDLSRLEFDAIGSPEMIDDKWTVTRRPLTRQMNELVATGACKRRDLPLTVFTSTKKYFVRLAQLHHDHLVHQQNNAISSELDCMRKYVARLLFRKMMDERAPSGDVSDTGPFKLWCDDFRPTNILLSGDEIAGVIDWEFTYAAPPEFSFAPPWWLLLKRPEEWAAGWKDRAAGWMDWSKQYEVRLVTFLAAMEKAEEVAITSGRLTEEQRLSPKMRQSWENGDFWVMYALQTECAFDDVFWLYIFPRLCGPIESAEAAWEKAQSLLSEQEMQGMQSFVSDKMPVWEDEESDEDPVLDSRDTAGRLTSQFNVLELKSSTAPPEEHAQPIMMPMSAA